MREIGKRCDCSPTTRRNIQETRNTHCGIPKSADTNDTDSIKDLSVFGIGTNMYP